MKKQNITSVSYIRIGEKQIETGQLGDAQRRELSTWLKSSYLNHMFQGTAIFQKKRCIPPIRTEGEKPQ